MQLIEQRLEFVVGDLVGDGAVFGLARSRLARSRLDGVEQLLELAIGASGSASGSATTCGAAGTTGAASAEAGSARRASAASSSGEAGVGSTRSRT